MNNIKFSYQKYKYFYYYISIHYNQVVSTNKLDKHNMYFSYVDSSRYFLKNNKLYYDDYGINVKVSDISVDRIIKQEDNNIYFISDTGLYYCDFYNGIKKLLDYSEWKYNNKNIYIFDN